MIGKADARNIWILIEHKGGKVAGVSLEAIGVARKLADSSSQEVWAVALGPGAQALGPDLIKVGADVVLTAEDARLDGFRDDPYTDALTHLVTTYKPSALIVGATSNGKSLAPRLASRLRTGLASECVDLEWDAAAGNLVAVRPMYGGNVLATVVCPEVRPQLATLRVKSAPRPEPDPARKGRVEKADISGVELRDRVKVLEAVETGGGEVKLEEADIVVSGGRGVGGPEKFSVIKALAEACRGAMGASRAAVDAGWLPYAHQVGQTGKTVSPKVYIACGISGAIQHLAGMKSSDIIVAINKNPEAPIFKVATYGIVGDLFEVVPLLTEEIKEASA
ncbi:MAG: electron transfer flavoprotein subunit alpha/FixB family protein [Bacillota bacterium]|jgi:electron transfer flavoprotein alpha subunit